jgi:hypothetical protein
MPAEMCKGVFIYFYIELVTLGGIIHINISPYLEDEDTDSVIVN